MFLSNTADIGMWLYNVYYLKLKLVPNQFLVMPVAFPMFYGDRRSNTNQIIVNVNHLFVEIVNLARLQTHRQCFSVTLQKLL